MVAAAGAGPGARSSTCAPRRAPRRRSSPRPRRTRASPPSTPTSCVSGRCARTWTGWARTASRSCAATSSSCRPPSRAPSTPCCSTRRAAVSGRSPRVPTCAGGAARRTSPASRSSSAASSAGPRAACGPAESSRMPCVRCRTPRPSGSSRPCLPKAAGKQTTSAPRGPAWRIRRRRLPARAAAGARLRGVLHRPPASRHGHGGVEWRRGSTAAPTPRQGGDHAGPAARDPHRAVHPVGRLLASGRRRGGGAQRRRARPARRRHGRPLRAEHHRSGRWSSPRCSRSCTGRGR